MISQAFPQCCGAQILLNFNGWDTSNKNYEEIDKRVKKEIYSHQVLTGRAFIIAILNSHQNEFIGEIFRDYGFHLAP